MMQATLKPATSCKGETFFTLFDIIQIKFEVARSFFIVFTSATKKQSLFSRETDALSN